ncbi:hypothetical protein [Streptomyces sp. V3I7]|uniref:hypothetical protein n=1 Tax=Streptomyces sp. V3I7 TaxID=3042278 RepID=UPI002786FD9B|nr:hypothetical protein [Streptomyces sp. V3I7]MDQ0990741.1 hypothetical protein [Streptomyces sp. V3I7]
MVGGGRLKAAVYVQDPTTREDLVLMPGDCPEPEVAALITNPDAWDVPPDGCEEPDEMVSAVKPELAENKDDGQEVGAGASGTKKPQTRRSRSSGS